MIEFDVKGTPKATPRVKASRRGSFIHMYTPKSADLWKNQIKEAALPHVPKTPLRGPLSVSLYFRMPRVGSHYFKRKTGNVLRPDAPTYHIVKPDRDNLEKAVLDSLTNIGMWQDDCQVCAGSVRKVYAFEGFEGVAIAIEEIETNEERKTK